MPECLSRYPDPAYEERSIIRGLADEAALDLVHVWHEIGPIRHDPIEVKEMSFRPGPSGRTG